MFVWCLSRSSHFQPLQNRFDSVVDRHRVDADLDQTSIVMQIQIRILPSKQPKIVIDKF